jgi:CelD/BcsL family acetyltransferase involved in cellulose biosynthesis
MLAPAETAFATEWRPLAGLVAVGDDWRALCERAAEPNVFYEPAFALAAAPAFGADASAVLVWSQAPRRLLGLFPLRLVPRRYGINLPLLVGWTHPYAPLGTPLIDQDAVAPVLSALFEHVASADALPARILLPFLVDDGPIVRALDDVLARRRGVQAKFGRHTRALLLPQRDGVDQDISKRKRKELARQRRRLSDIGEAAFECVSVPAAMGPALDDFLVLEASGWKGAARTAALNHVAIHRFMANAVTGLAAEGKASVVRLLLDGRSLACGLMLRSGDGEWFWKIAYDENFARFSPGALLTLDLTQTLSESNFAFVDSCAAADHPMIGHFWRGRRPISDRLIALDPGPSFALACRLESLRRRAVATAKRMRDMIHH